MVYVFDIFLAVFILIGVVIYGAAADEQLTVNLNYGFAFVVVAAVLALIGSVCLCFGIAEKWRVDPVEWNKKAVRRPTEC